VYHKGKDNNTWFHLQTETEIDLHGGALGAYNLKSIFIVKVPIWVLFTT
jgi:hypothetical protein